MRTQTQLRGRRRQPRMARISQMNSAGVAIITIFIVSVLSVKSVVRFLTRTSESIPSKRIDEDANAVERSTKATTDGTDFTDEFSRRRDYHNLHRIRVISEIRGSVLDSHQRKYSE